MTDHEHEEYFEEEQLLIDHPRYAKPRIFEGNWQGQTLNDFDAVTIDLDGRVQADLDWKKAKEQALKAVEKGYALMWNINLGLFQGLHQPLTQQSQFLSLTLSLEHFRDSLWKEFKAQTLGISLFRGDVDFSQGFPWNSHQEQNLREWLKEMGQSELSNLTVAQIEQQIQGKRLLRLFCRDVAIEYISLLASRLPDTLPAYLYLDVASLKESLADEMELLNPERFDRLHLVLKNHQLPLQAWGWQRPTEYGYSGCEPIQIPQSKEKTIGVCVPTLTDDHFQIYQSLEKALILLKNLNLPFKLIAEAHLTAQWDGLDYLFYTPLGLSTQGKRKLQGFCAAGGNVVSTEHLLNLPYEMNLEEWKQTVKS